MKMKPAHSKRLNRSRGGDAIIFIMLGVMGVAAVFERYFSL